MAGLSLHEELIALRKRARRRLVGAIVMVLVSGAIVWQVVSHVPDQQMRPELVEITGNALEAAHKKAQADPQGLPNSLAPAVTPSYPEQLASAPSAQRPSLSTELPASLASISAEKPEEAPTIPRTRVLSHVPVQSASPKVSASGWVTVPEPPKREPAPLKRDTVPKLDPAAILEGRIDGEAALSAANKENKEHNTATSKVFIQLAALSDKATVDILHNKLDNLGISARFTQVETSKGTLTRVRIGPFAAQQEAEVVMKKLARMGISGTIISK